MTLYSVRNSDGEFFQDDGEWGDYRPRLYYELSTAKSVVTQLTNRGIECTPVVLHVTTVEKV